MVGMGKLAIAVVLTMALAFGLVASVSMAKTGQTADGVCDSGALCNGTVQMAEMAGTQSANLLVPVVILLGVLFLFSVFVFLKRRA